MEMRDSQLMTTNNDSTRWYLLHMRPSVGHTRQGGKLCAKDCNYKWHVWPKETSSKHL